MMSAASGLGKGYRLSLLAGSIFMAFSLLMITLSVRAQPPDSVDTVVYLSAPDGPLYAGDEITVTVGISSVIDLFRAEMTVEFNPAHLSVVDTDVTQEGIQITPGDCPEPDFISLNAADNTAGTVMYWVSQINPTLPVSGDCDVAYIRLLAHQITTTTMGFGDLLLATESTAPIPHITEGLELDLLQPPPIADFAGSPSSGIAPTLVSFINLSSGIYTTCFWDFGDGNIAPGCSGPFNNYTTSGVYTVSLSVSGPFGMDTKTRFNYITIYEPVSVDFTGSPTTGTAPLSVDFANLSTGDFDTCDWNFGDGTSDSTCSDLDHEYASRGSFTVSLSVSGFGGSDSLTSTNHITVYEPVTASFSSSPTSGIAPLHVDFSNHSAGDFDTCSWLYGDGGSSSDCHDPSHEYPSGGVFSVSLSVSGLGGSDVLTRSSYITVYEPVVASFVGDPISGAAPLQVDFTNSSSGSFDTCSWDFGDGSDSDVCDNPSYIYPSTGVFTITLVVTGLGGADILSRTSYITVFEPVFADFVASPTSGVVPFLVHFANNSSGDFDSCTWDFGDGDDSDECIDPDHLYTVSGIFTVVLAVSGPGGVDSEVKSQYIIARAFYFSYLPYLLGLPQ